MNNRYIRLDENNKVVAVRIGTAIVPGELQSDIGKMDQIMQLDGTFIDNPEVVTQPHVPTNTEIAQMISDLQADLLIAGVIQ